MATTLENALNYDEPIYEDNPTYSRKRMAALDKLYPGEYDPTGFLNKFDVVGNAIKGSFGKKKKSSLAGWQKIANKEWAMGNATLSAYERLFPRTLSMVAKSKNSFGDLELDLFKKYGNKYIDAIDSADPAQGALRQQLTQQVTADLNSPGVTPSIAREIQQGSRAAWGSRGLAQSPASAIEELFSLGERGNQLQQQKYSNASSVLSQNKQLVGDPFLAITGRSATTQQPNYAGFNDDLFSYGVNSQMQSANKRAAKSAGKQAMTGQIVGGLLSSAGSLGALCWLAREVYGAANPRWKQFRRWLLEAAPRELFDWYLANGRRAAETLRRKPELKPAVQAWMDMQLA